MGSKKIWWTFQETNKQSVIRENFNMVKKGKNQEKTESLLIAVQKTHTIRTNYIKAKIDKTQQNS